MSFERRELEFDDPAPLAPKTYNLLDLTWERIAGRLEQMAIGLLRLDAGRATQGRQVPLKKVEAFAARRGGGAPG